MKHASSFNNNLPNISFVQCGRANKHKWNAVLQHVTERATTRPAGPQCDMTEHMKQTAMQHTHESRHNTTITLQPQSPPAGRHRALNECCRQSVTTGTATASTPQNKGCARKTMHNRTLKGRRLEAQRLWPRPLGLQLLACCSDVIWARARSTPACQLPPGPHCSKAVIKPQPDGNTACAALLEPLASTFRAATACSGLCLGLQHSGNNTTLSNGAALSEPLVLLNTTLTGSAALSEPLASTVGAATACSVICLGLQHSGNNATLSTNAALSEPQGPCTVA